jgi:hypothetical protein
MGAFFRIEMLPAQHGDALWIEYGSGSDTNRILIDGGTIKTYPFLAKRLRERCKVSSSAHCSLTEPRARGQRTARHCLCSARGRCLSSVFGAE